MLCVWLFHVSAGDLNLSLHACITSTLPTEPPPKHTEVTNCAIKHVIWEQEEAKSTFCMHLRLNCYEHKTGLHNYRFTHKRPMRKLSKEKCWLPSLTIWAQFLDPKWWEENALKLSSDLYMCTNVNMCTHLTLWSLHQMFVTAVTPSKMFSQHLYHYEKEENVSFPISPDFRYGDTWARHCDVITWYSGGWGRGQQVPEHLGLHSLKPAWVS